MAKMFLIKSTGKDEKTCKTIVSSRNMSQHQKGRNDEKEMFCLKIFER